MTLSPSSILLLNRHALQIIYTVELLTCDEEGDLEDQTFEQRKSVGYVCRGGGIFCLFVFELNLQSPTNLETGNVNEATFGMNETKVI